MLAMAELETNMGVSKNFDIENTEPWTSDLENKSSV